MDSHRPADDETQSDERTSRRSVLVVVVACLLAFALLAWQAVAETGLARVDVHVQHFVVRHRVGWLTDGFRALAWLGSVTVLALVLVVVGTVLLMTRRDALGAVLPAAALAGTIVAKNAAKALIERPRPSPASAIGSNAGFAFPSGHAADSLAAYVMLVMILSVGRSRPVRRALWFAATALVLVVGASRVYLGAQWSTDVLGGWALAGAIVAMLGRAFSLPRSPLPRDSPVTPRGGPART